MKSKWKIVAIGCFILGGMFYFDLFGSLFFFGLSIVCVLIDTKLQSQGKIGNES